MKFPYWDTEAHGMAIIASHLEAEQYGLWPKIRSIIMDRLQSNEAGVLEAPKWLQKKLKEIDPLLVLRWNYEEQCFCVDRYVPIEKHFTTVCTWKDENGPKRLDLDLLETIQDGDLWRFPSYKEYLAHKREKAARRRLANQKASEDAVLTAVDKLSSKDIAEFVSVGNALKSGETIECHGNDEHFFNKYHRAGQQNQARQYNANRRI